LDRDQASPIGEHDRTRLAMVWARIEAPRLASIEHFKQAAFHADRGAVVQDKDGRARSRATMPVGFRGGELFGFVGRHGGLPLAIETAEDTPRIGARCMRGILSPCGRDGELAGGYVRVDASEVWGSAAWAGRKPLHRTKR